MSSNPKNAKRTKIVATISDYRCTPEFIQNLLDEGMNVVRFNSAHITPDAADKMLKAVRSVSADIPVLIDTKGPEVRITEIKEPFEFNTGDTFTFEGNIEGVSSPDAIYVNYNNFANEISVGNKILIDDGELEFDVIDKKDGKLFCKATNSGTMKGRKSVNVPGVHVKLPSLSQKDLSFIEWAIEADVDFIAHSFVRDKHDVLDIQKLLDAKDSKIKIISKIENQVGVDNLEEILDYSYGIMVARGDLGIEIEAQKIPTIQRNMIETCIRRKKPVIVATQMLHTMIENPRPTRAEVSDVANAIYSKTDCIMLSGETAYGDYPMEAVRTMTNIAREVEASIAEKHQLDQTAAVDNEIPAFLAKTAVSAIEELDIASIVSDTFTGRTVRFLSAFRPTRPVYGICYSDRIKRELMLSYGVFPYTMDVWKTSDEFKLNALKLLLDDGKITKEDLIVIMGGNFNPNTGVSFSDISTVSTIIEHNK